MRLPRAVPRTGSATRFLCTLRSMTKGIHPAVPLLIFPVVLMVDTMLGLSISGDISPWTWRFGVLIGGLLGFGIPFVLWAYLVISTFLILVILDQVVSLPRLGEVVAVLFVYATVGKLGEIVLKVTGFDAIAVWPYLSLGMIGIAATIYSTHKELAVPAAEAFLAVALSIATLVAVVYSWGFYR